MQRILLIEDCVETQITVRGLLSHRFQVTCASLASDAFRWIEEISFDLILLDIMLYGSDTDGFHICSQLKNKSKTCEVPIVFMTGKDNTTDKVMGFALGADDYIVKPFDPLEFRARIEAKLNNLKKKREHQESLWRGDIRINLPLQKAFRVEGSQEKDLGLTPNEFKLLFHLARHEGYLFTRNHLISVIWGENIHVIDRTVDAHIYTLRRKLGTKSNHIESVPGQGYRFKLQM